MAKNETVKKKKSWFREFVEIVVVAFLLAFVIKVFVFEFYKIPSGSMTPTLLVGDRIVVVKFIYGPRLPFVNFRLPGFREPKIGDIVVFKAPPPNIPVSFIKRFIAGEGATVEIKNNRLIINGKEVDDPPAFRRIYGLGGYYNRGDFWQGDKQITVPKDSYLVLGDNSANSKDSRYWGFVPKSNLIGKAVFIMLPFDRMQIITDK